MFENVNLGVIDVMNEDIVIEYIRWFNGFTGI